MLGTALVTALATGALGSAHCAAMCGPLVVAGSSCGEGTSPRAAAAYFAGRLLSYASVGAVLGHVGGHALSVLPTGAIEGAAAAVVALAMAHRGFALLRGSRPVEPLISLRTKRARSPLLTLLGQLWPRRGLGLGLATGVLPCGLLLPAWALAAGTASAPAGALVMAAFSVATLPGLVVPLAGRRLLQRALARLPRVAYGVAWCALAAWVGLRPLLVASGRCH